MLTYPCSGMGPLSDLAAGTGPALPARLWMGQRNVTGAQGVRRSMTRAVAAALAGVLAMASLTACGSVQQLGHGSASSPTAPISTSATTTTRTNPMPTPPTGPPEDMSAPPTTTGSHSSVRVRGTVSDGVEPGCMLLTSKGVVYQLIWRHGTPVTGQQIEVEGTLQ